MERSFLLCSTRIFTRPLMFNKYTNDIFLFPHNVCLSNILSKKFLSLQKWFYANYMDLNPGKCSYMSFGSNPDKSDLILKDSTKFPSAEEYVEFL